MHPPFHALNSSHLYAYTVYTQTQEEMGDRGAEVREDDTPALGH